MPSPLTTDATDPVQRLLRRTPVTSPLSSEQWSQMPLAFRERAFFSSKVEELRFLAQAQNGVTQIADGKSTVAEQRAALKELLKSIGYQSDPDNPNELQDLSSDRRLELILDTNLQQAQGYADFVSGQDAAILDRWPCQELIRVIQAEKPRDWAKRWADAGGQFFNGRMIARKDDPIWTDISRFGTPYPPFDFGSGMDLRDIDREEAIALGVIAPDDKIKPQLPDFNAKLEAGIPDATPGLLEAFTELFGDQIGVENGKVFWREAAQ